HYRDGGLYRVEKMTLHDWGWRITAIGSDVNSKECFLSTTANCLCHVKPDPLKELLSELANEVWEASCTCQTTWSDSGLDGIEERYANRIRELMKDGGDD
ncbi:MAG: hypothetical protein IIZ12_03570, partial [Eggerthellaceae bacterium]|nr:hypothetical protein [Eggerthellaceae bacterium]